MGMRITVDIEDGEEGEDRVNLLFKASYMRRALEDALREIKERVDYGKHRDPPDSVDFTSGIECARDILVDALDERDVLDMLIW